MLVVILWMRVVRLLRRCVMVDFLSGLRGVVEGLDLCALALRSFVMIMVLVILLFIMVLVHNLFFHDNILQELKAHHGV